ncbi:MAG TPA: isoprenylcysteine carboxylmethyltransferase family protein [Candidatus Cybelea sp.]|nr:isoprenylcysteine carboxylmethyltransferase family protein [Candidatus Cybelea sp.]
MNEIPDNPGVVARPPLIYLGALLAGALLQFADPVALLPWDLPALARIAIGIVVALDGVALMTFAFPMFRRHGTNVQTGLPVNAIITDGPYRFTRNPLYVSMTLIYAGIAFAADSAWIAGLLVPVLFVIRYGVIAREELYLERKFGATYLDYKSRVRRWI